MSDINNNPVWPGWKTVRLIGHGSYGEVYEIEREIFDEKEKAALKVITIPQSSSDIDELYSEGYDNETITATFKTQLKSIVAEYSLMRKMNGSANVVNCDDVRCVQHDDGFGWDIFIKMELLTPITKALGKKISENQVIRIGTDMCRALILCKKHNIIHRDIKPANIFVSENGDYKLGDFGIAKTVEKTSGGTKIGTYDYMAPEVYNDQPYGSTADIYSVGMVLYWLLNERRVPFLGSHQGMPTVAEKEEARMRRFSGEKMQAPEKGSDDLKRIVLKACAYDVKDRYQSADEMLADLEELSGVGMSSVSAPPVISESVSPTEEERTLGVWELSEHNITPEKSTGKCDKEAFDAQENKTDTADLKEKNNQTGVWEKQRKTVSPAENEDAGMWGERENALKADEEKTIGIRHVHGKSEAMASYLASAPKRKKKGLVISLISVLAILVVGAAAYFTIHIWTPATCTEASVCRICGKIGESAHGHEWEDGTCMQPPRCKYCGEWGNAALGHDWIEATCTEPSVCRICGKVGAPAHGHEWENATCTKVPKCKVCGAEGDAPLGHTWTPATYTQPEVCSVCGAIGAHELNLFGFDMTLDQFNVKAMQLVSSASSWTIKNVPRTIDELPLFPKSFFVLYEMSKNAVSEIEINGSDLTWKTDLAEIFPESLTGSTGNFQFSYPTSKTGDYTYIGFDENKGHTHKLQMPKKAGVFLALSNKVGYETVNDIGGWNSVFSIYYDIVKNNKLNEVFTFKMDREEYSIIWTYYVEAKKIEVDICSKFTDQEWVVTYNSSNKNLITLQTK